MRKTPITHLNPTYIQCFSPPPKIMIMHCNRQNFLVSRNSTLTGKQKQIDRVAIRQFSLFTILILENSSSCKHKIRARSIFCRIHKKANNHFLMHWSQHCKGKSRWLATLLEGAGCLFFRVWKFLSKIRFITGY